MTGGFPEEMLINGHRFSPDEYEFVLATRRFYPPASHTIILAVALGIVTLVAAVAEGNAPWISAIIAFGVAIVSLGAVPLLFLWRSGQLAVGNYLVGNVNSIAGHVNWPPIWQNILAERAVTFNWVEVRDAVLFPDPWFYADGNLNLELKLRDGRRRVLRVPKLSLSEADALVQVLELISLRRGFTFAEGKSEHYFLRFTSRALDD